MTKTEQRLTDALDAVARAVPEESLPPIPVLGPVRRPWADWLAPIAAAAGVTLVVVLVSAIHLLSGTPPGGEGQTAGPPRYYVTQQDSQILIRKTSTGTVTARIPDPYAGHPTSGMLAVTVAAVADGRDFIAAYAGALSRSGAEQTRLFSFRVTAAGHVTGFSLVKRGVLRGLYAGSAMAVSPDGSRVALAVGPWNPSLASPSPPSPAQIVVIDLRTGASSLWKGGLQRPGLAFSIPSISWAADGRSLVFLGQWCQVYAEGGFCEGPGTRDSQVRTLSLAAGGGLLSGGSILLADSARYPNIAQALLSSGGKVLNLVVLRGPYLRKNSGIPQDLRVMRVPLSRGERPRLLYHGRTEQRAAVFLGSDPSGRYLLLAWGRNGWIDHSRLRLLPPQGGYAFAETW